MTPEVQLIEAYNKWFSEFRRTPDVGDPAKLAAGLEAYITDETILNEPASVPWGGTLVGYAGWEKFLKGIDPALRTLAGKFSAGDATYYQSGNVVLREFVVTISGSAANPVPFTMGFIEKYTIAEGRIEQIDEFYADTASFLTHLAYHGVPVSRMV